MFECVTSRVFDVSLPFSEDKIPGVLVQGNQNADRYDIHVTRGGVPLDISGATIVGNFLFIPDGAEAKNGRTIYVPGTISSDPDYKNVVSLVLSDFCYEQPGRYYLTIDLIHSEIKRTIYACSGIIIRSAGELKG